MKKKNNNKMQIERKNMRTKDNDDKIIIES